MSESKTFRQALDELAGIQFKIQERASALSGNLYSESFELLKARKIIEDIDALYDIASEVREIASALVTTPVNAHIDPEYAAKLRESMSDEQ